MRTCLKLSTKVSTVLQRQLQAACKRLAASAIWADVLRCLGPLLILHRHSHLDHFAAVVLNSRVVQVLHTAPLQPCVVTWVGAAALQMAVGASCAFWTASLCMSQADHTCLCLWRPSGTETQAQSLQVGRWCSLPPAALSCQQVQ